MYIHRSDQVNAMIDNRNLLSYLRLYKNPVVCVSIEVPYHGN